MEPRKERNKEKDAAAAEDGDKDGGWDGEQNVNGDGGISSGVDKDMKVVIRRFFFLFFPRVCRVF